MSAPYINIGGKSLSADEAIRLARRAGMWFWLIAFISLVNSVANSFNMQFGMLGGLGVTLLVDGYFLFDMNGVLIQLSSSSRIAHLSAIGAIAGTFAWFGFQARKFRMTSYQAGIVFYVFDEILFAVVGEWGGVIVHAVFLFFLWGGYQLQREVLKKMPQISAGET